MTKGSTVIEQPSRMLVTAVKDGPPVGAERLVYLAEQVDDPLRDLCKRWWGRFAPAIRTWRVCLC